MHLSGSHPCPPTGLFQPALDLVPCPTPQGPLPGVCRKKGLTLHQALELRGRQAQPLRCPTIGPHALLLSPVYEVQATMNRESCCGARQGCWGVESGGGGGLHRFVDRALTRAAWVVAGRVGTR